MGIVVAAQHLRLNERVAIKFMTSSRREDRLAVARFRDEARAARRIQSEHVVRVLDFDVLDDGVPYIVMEYLTGADLEKRLSRSGPVSLPQAVDWILEACEAIAEAHRLGVVHRDLKPANLFVFEREGAQPSIKVLDFGISKNTTWAAQTQDPSETAPSAGMTNSRAILGSPLYMSPEQMDSAREVDFRTDIWSLGVTLFQLVVGEVPFPGSSLFQVQQNIMADAPSWPVRLAARGPELVPVLAKCLDADRDRRYASVADFALALAPLGSRAGAAQAHRIVRAQAGSAPPPSDGPESQRITAVRPTVLEKVATGSRDSKRSALVAVLAVGLVMAFVLNRIRRNGSSSAALASSDIPVAVTGSVPAVPPAIPIARVTTQEGTPAAPDAGPSMPLPPRAGGPLMPAPSGRSHAAPTLPDRDALGQPNVAAGRESPSTPVQDAAFVLGQTATTDAAIAPSAPAAPSASVDMNEIFGGQK